jgi:hypothetical protein
VRWLSEHPDQLVDRVILVAPWIDPQRKKTTDFFDFKIASDLAHRTAGLVIFNSDNDGQDIQESVLQIRKAVHDVQYREFHNYGHFCFNDMKTTEFPELLEAILRP